MARPEGGRYDYQGLVIGSCSAEFQEHETNLVLILKSQRERMELKNRIYGVSKGGFYPPTIEKSFENIEIAKNRERRYAMPLKFGDVIMWDEHEVNHGKRLIHRFYREKPLYEVMSNENGQAIKVGGVIEPDRPTTFWTPLETVSIPMLEASRAEPDVWLQAWLKVETCMKSSQDPYHLELTFDSFAGFEPGDQSRVSEAPWHRNSLDSKFATWLAEPTPCDEDDLLDLEPRKDIWVEENKWAEKINCQLGLFVGERLLVCKDLTQYDFIIPLMRPNAVTQNEKTHEDEKKTFTWIYPTVGEYFHFSAIWSMHHRAFLVTEMNQFQLLRGHTVSPSGHLVVRVTSSAIPGLFTDIAGTLGLIDDPNHNLSMLEFHPAVYEQLHCMVEIRAVRVSENRSVRYRIVRALNDDENMSRFEAWLQEKEFLIGPMNGIVISKDTVICHKYPNVYFRLPPNLQNFPLGTGVQVYGKRNVEVTSEIMITEASIVPSFSIRKIVGKEGNCMFQVKITPVPDHVQLGDSDRFGIVDMRGLDPPERSEGGEYDAWVRESPRHLGTRRACTIMEVFSTALATPMLPMTGSGSRSGSNKTSYSSSSSPRTTPNTSSHGSTGSDRSARSIAHNRFVGRCAAQSTSQPLRNNESPA